MMGFWEKLWSGINKRDVLILDGREVTIVVNSNNYDQQRINLVKAEIEIVSKTEPVAKRFPWVVYYLQDQLPENRLLANRRPSGFANADAGRGIFEIYLNLNTLDESRQIRKVILHELVHLYQEAKSQLLTRNKKLSEQLIAVIKKRLISSDLSEVKRHHAWIRVYLMEFFRGLLTEGQAKFCEYYFTDEIKFSKEYFLWTYSQAQQQAEKLYREWLNYYMLVSRGQWEKAKSVQDSFIAIYENSYLIGLHVIYTLLYLGKNISFNAITKMGIFKIVKTYEKLIAEAGYNPIISATSNSGIIDYKQMVADWWLAIKTKQKD